ncbi:MAG: hypothetical protein ACYDAO_02385 [Thermoplasmataceae archaeon]
MLIKDIDKVLDMRIVLRLRQSTDLFKSTAKITKPMSVYIYLEDEKTMMTTYFRKADVSNDSGLFLKKYNAIELEDAYAITSRINNQKDLFIIGELLNLPSVVINRSDMNSGFLNVYMRFHRTMAPEISKLLAKYTMDKDNSRVQWLGPSMGIINIINIINSQYPISVITYITSLDQENLEFVRRFEGIEFLLEIKNVRTIDDGFGSILYTSEKTVIGRDDGIKIISEEDGVYEMILRNKILSEVRERANRAHISRLRYFVKIINEKAEVTVFLPTDQIYEYYSILFDLARETDTDISLKYMLPYSTDIWDFI